MENNVLNPSAYADDNPRPHLYDRPRRLSEIADYYDVSNYTLKGWLRTAGLAHLLVRNSKTFTINELRDVAAMLGD